MTWLAKLFIKHPEKMTPAERRAKYGTLCCIFGIVLNAVLFAGKLITGLLIGAVSVVADAMNNLTDSASSVVTLFGFRLAAHKPDNEHPFGHGRVEYVSGLVVSFLILLVGLELGRSSVTKIIHPEAVEFSVVPAVILGISILVKLYMAYYNGSIGKKIASTAMRSTALDSMLDAVTTTVILICLLIGHFFDVKMDAYCGLAVAIFILYSGVRSVKETVSPLLGEPPSKELVAEIENTVKSFDGILGVHDLIVHDYGPDRLMVSLHAEVSANENLMEIHDVIDRAEKALYEKLHCDAVIHMDPIQVEDAYVVKTFARIKETVKLLHPSVTVHDFRMKTEGENTLVIFDAVVPREVDMTDREAMEKLSELTRTVNPDFIPKISIDRAKVI